LSATEKGASSENRGRKKGEYRKIEWARKEAFLPIEYRDRGTRAAYKTYMKANPEYYRQLAGNGYRLIIEDIDGCVRLWSELALRILNGELSDNSFLHSHMFRVVLEHLNIDYAAYIEALRNPAIVRRKRQYGRKN
jgi:hypothetical protein